jgi:hypothetical protein
MKGGESMAKSWQTVLKDLKETKERLNREGIDTCLNDVNLEDAAKGWAIILAGPSHPTYQPLVDLLHKSLPEFQGRGG